MNALTLLNNFEREFARPFWATPARGAWLSDLTENESMSFSSELVFDKEKSAWYLNIEMAGVTKDKVKVDTQEGYLRIAGEKTRGLNKGAFETRYNIPENVDLEKVAATFEDGILTIEMPVEAKKAAKTIEIK
ncbi:MAG: Hsp20/alpha crystallin family protein [Pseudobdellovibrio sp.]